MKAGLLAGLALALALAPALPASGLRLSGYGKLYFGGLLPAGADDGPTGGAALGLASTRLRLQLDCRPLTCLSLQLAYDLMPQAFADRIQEAGPLFYAPEAGSYRWRDLATAVLPDAHAAAATLALRQNLDRLNVQVKLPWAQLVLGRQVIAWGSARVVNPTDVIAPFTFHELDAEDRRGVDAVRLRLPAGERREVDLGWVSGPQAAGGLNAWFVRGSANLWQSDCSLLLLSFRRHALLGIDVSRSLGGAAVWLEAAFVRPHEEPGAAAAGYFRASGGIEYFFSDRLSGFCEYHFSSAGTGDPARYPELLSRPAYRDGAVYLMGRHYLCLGGVVQIHPLIPLTVLAIGNLEDRSLELAPSLECSLSQSLYLEVGAYVGLGRGTRAAADGTPLYRSEFGSYPDVVFASLRAYF
jgi:hypothetical protein